MEGKCDIEVINTERDVDVINEGRHLRRGKDLMEEEDEVKSGDDNNERFKQRQGEDGNEERTKDGSCDATADVIDSFDDKIETESTIKHQGKVEMKNPSTRVVSSIDISIPQVENESITKEDVLVDNNNDDSDETGSVAMGTTKNVNFFVHHNMDAAAEISIVTMVNKDSNDQMSRLDVEAASGGRAAKTNTPVTRTPEFQNGEKNRITRTHSQESIFKHALSVMRNGSSYANYTKSRVRIKSVPSSAEKTVLSRTADGLPVYSLPTVVGRIKEPPLVDCANCSFYVVQKRVHGPVPPFKAWKGYHSNVYFEPMVCRKATISSLSTPRKYPQNMIEQSTQKSSRKLFEGTRLPHIYQTNLKTNSLTASNTCQSVRRARPAVDVTLTKRQATAAQNHAGTSVPRSRFSTTTRSTHQLAVLDKLSVLDSKDSNTDEEIKWIDSMESTGALHIGEPLRPTGTTTHIYRRATGSRHYKMRICRGLVSHNIGGQDDTFSHPALGVSGGRIKDSSSKLDYLEQAYQGQSHFLTNPHGMFASPIPIGNHSTNPVPSLQPSASSTLHRPVGSVAVNLTFFTNTSVVSGK